MNTVLAALVAIVVHDEASLRASPEASAPRQATLYRGDWLEVRGEEGDWLRVWDHRRERPGFVKTYLVRPYELTPATAPELLALTRFHRDMPGGESLGIGFAALFLRAADPDAIDAEIFDALASMAQRLAERASGRGVRTRDKMIGAHIDVARSYGVRFASVEQGPDRIETCYDGEAFRRVLSMPATPRQRAEAALSLSDPRCDEPSPSPTVDFERSVSRDRQLAALDPTELAPALGNELRIRRAELNARLAFYHARREQADKARVASETARAMYLRVDKAHLSRSALRRYQQAGIAVGAAKWARAPEHSLPRSVRLVREDSGQTCIEILSKKQPSARRCTHARVWPSSIRASADATTVAVAVQPLPEWVELWIFKRKAGVWTVDVLVPAIAQPTRGFVEWAGFGPSTLLVAREAQIDGRLERRYQALALTTLEPVIEAKSLARFATFRRHKASDWTLGGR